MKEQEKVVETTAEEVKEETTVEKKKFNFKKIGIIVGAVVATAAAVIGGVAVGKKMNGSDSDEDFFLAEPEDDYIDTEASVETETTED
jgi:hypothetical protein|nr:MAG TPA: coat protein [Caudoviricetes sp.]